MRPITYNYFFANSLRIYSGVEGMNHSGFIIKEMPATLTYEIFYQKQTTSTL
jgi:hypothetical protein